MGRLHPPIQQTTLSQKTKHLKNTRNHQESPCQRDQDSPNHSSCRPSSRNCWLLKRTKCPGRRLGKLCGLTSKLTNFRTRTTSSTSPRTRPWKESLELRRFGLSEWPSFLKGHLG